MHQLPFRSGTSVLVPQWHALLERTSVGLGSQTPSMHQLPRVQGAARPLAEPHRLERVENPLQHRRAIVAVRSGLVAGQRA